MPIHAIESIGDKIDSSCGSKNTECRCRQKIGAEKLQVYRFVPLWIFSSRRFSSSLGISST